MELLFGLFWAVCCGILANNKNRNVVAWSIAGLLLGLFALIPLALLPKLED